MKNVFKSIAGIALVVSVAAMSAGCSSEKEGPEISFKHHVSPILKKNCIECHHAPDGKGYMKSGLLMVESDNPMQVSYENLMKGTKHGPVINPGSSIDSTLVMLVEGRADPSLKMPHGGRDMLEPDTRVIKLWVDQGAKNN